MSLALWLRSGRCERGMSLSDVARVTKIQTRILERLEGGKLDGLPAEVFVRGFIRSFARCCGLDESEALTRYSAAAQAQQTATAPAMPNTLAAPPAARAVIDAMADLAPQIAMQERRATQSNLEAVSAIEVMDLAAGSLAMPAADAAAQLDATVEPGETKPVSNRQKKKQRNKKRAKRATQRSEMATGTPWTPTPVVGVEVLPEAAAEVVDAAPATEAEVDVVDAGPARDAVEGAHVEAAVVEAARVEAPAVEAAAPVVDHLDPLVEPADANEDVVATEAWQPKMPVAAAPSVPWRRPAYAARGRAATASIQVPTLVIDDADPESAEQLVEERAAAKSVLTNAQRRSFLPPILLDREDRSARQGGLTLAVIILLIAATLTLSYLMRRPSSSGDGVTSNDVESELVVG